MIPLRDDNPSRTPPVVTVSLIVANVLAFLYQLSLGQDGMEQLVMRLGLIPAEVTGAATAGTDVPVPLTFLTSMFLHGDLMHLGGNMLYLWIFGNNVEDETGHLLFPVFYLACGLAAAGLQVAVKPDSAIPMIGASGAIAGVLGAYLILFPHARVLTLVPIVFILRLMYLPALVVLGLWFVYQLLLSGTSGGGGGVAFFAHIGGFVAGMALILLFKGPSAWRREIGQRAVRYRREDSDDWPPRRGWS